MTKKKLTSKEKIEKAKKHLEELHALKLTPEEMEKVAGGDAKYGKKIWDTGKVTM